MIFCRNELDKLSKDLPKLKKELKNLGDKIRTVEKEVEENEEKLEESLSSRVVLEAASRDFNSILPLQVISLSQIKDFIFLEIIFECLGRD